MKRNTVHTWTCKQCGLTTQSAVAKRKHKESGCQLVKTRRDTKVRVGLAHMV